MIPLRFLLPFIVFITIFTILAIDKYAGEFYIFVLFTITSNLLLYFGFRKNAIFFDTFIGVFLWLGFWLKTTVRVIFFDSKFKNLVGSFDGSPYAFDQALIVTSIAFLALILASLIREKFVFSYPDEKNEEKSALFFFYTHHRKKVLILYTFLFVTVAVTNYYFGIYQRGEITQTVLPFGLNGVYKWLLLFGLSSFAALILKYEFSLQRKVTYFVPVLTLIEACITNVSLLSRGMILNTSALGFGFIKVFKTSSKVINIKFWLIILIFFVGLFLSSLVVVNEIRQTRYYKANIDTGTRIGTEVEQAVNGVKILFLDRWVGIEGVLSVSSSSKKGWPLLQDAVNEKYDEHKTSFYDLNLISTAYKNGGMNKHHFISLPGFIAFFYYAGSIVFLFAIIGLLGLLAGLIELFAYKLSGKNLILAALIAQVVAYRYTHFGYVPAQSYLLFGAIILNVFMIYALNKLLSIRYK
jgi:hypothetical protein